MWHFAPYVTFQPCVRQILAHCTSLLAHCTSLSWSCGHAHNWTPSTPIAQHPPPHPHPQTRALARHLTSAIASVRGLCHRPGLRAETSTKNWCLVLILQATNMNTAHWKRRDYSGFHDGRKYRTIYHGNSYANVLCWFGCVNIPLEGTSSQLLKEKLKNETSNIDLHSPQSTIYCVLGFLIHIIASVIVLLAGELRWKAVEIRHHTEVAM